MKLHKILFALSIFIASKALDNPHFYKASQFFYKPRLAEDGLLSITAYTNWGGGDCGYNKNKELVPLLDIWGNQNMHLIAKGVPSSTLDKNPSSILNDLWQQDTECTFGQLCFSGNFKILSGDFDIQKNACNGFFLHLHLPVRKLKIYNIKFKDFSTEQNAGPDVDFKDWENFIANFDNNMNKYGFCLNSETSSKGAGDLTLTVGKAVNYEKTKRLDFLDASLQIGILFPTGKAANPDNPFELPTGYNKHWGVPIATSFSLGLFEWVTFGTYLNLIIFRSNRQCVRMKTDPDQNGPIKLASGDAQVKRGPLVTYGLYFEADHMTKGFSFIFGYQFNKQSKTELCPYNPTIFNPVTVNTDSTLKGWKMSTLNFLVEYDFADLENPDRPKVGVTLDLTVSGRQVFKTKVGGFYLGADISGNF